MGGVHENGLPVEEVVTLTTGGVKRGVLWGDGSKFNVDRHDGGGRGNVDDGPGAVGGGPRYGIAEEVCVCGFKGWFLRGDITKTRKSSQTGTEVEQRGKSKNAFKGTTRCGERSDQKVLSDTMREVVQPFHLVPRIVVKACDQRVWRERQARDEQLRAREERALWDAKRIACV